MYNKCACIKGIKRAIKAQRKEQLIPPESIEKGFT